MRGILIGFAIIFFVIAAGYILARKKIIGGDEQRLVLNRVAFFAATPALMVTVVGSSHPDELFSPVIAVETLAALITAGLFAVLYLWFAPNDAARDRGTVTMGATAAGYVNSNNIGLPVGMYVLSNAAYVAPLLVVQMVLLTPLILALITPRKAEGSRTRQVLGAIKGGLLSPIVIGAAVGLVLSLTRTYEQVPEIIVEPLTLLGGASIPMILISFGASLHGTSVLQQKQYRLGTVLATGLKVVGMPLVAFACAWVAGLRADDLYAAVILAALPTAQNAYNYAATYRRGEIISRDTIMLSTFLALPAMLLIALVFGR